MHRPKYKKAKKKNKTYFYCVIYVYFDLHFRLFVLVVFVTLTVPLAVCDSLLFFAGALNLFQLPGAFATVRNIKQQWCNVTRLSYLNT